MPIRDQMPVTAESSDQEIIEAIQKAGEYTWPWRQEDRAKPGDNNPKSWVIPNDIGYSSKKRPAFLKRLHKMVTEGKLEREYTSKRINTAPLGFAPNWKCVDSMPRFRVNQSYLATLDPI